MGLRVASVSAAIAAIDHEPSLNFARMHFHSKHFNDAPTQIMRHCFGTRTKMCRKCTTGRYGHFLSLGVIFGRAVPPHVAHPKVDHPRNVPQGGCLLEKSLRLEGFGVDGSK